MVLVLGGYMKCMYIWGMIVCIVIITAILYSYVYSNIDDVDDLDY